MDADTVVLNRNGIIYPIKECNDKQISISSENHTDYINLNNNFGIKNILDYLYKIKEWSF